MGAQRAKSLLVEIPHLYSRSIQALKRDPSIGFLFLILGIVNFAALMTLFYAPSNRVLAPIIRTLWGDRFLHYPENFALLPKLYNYAHLVILTVLGVFITGLVIKKLEAQQKSQRIAVSAAVPSVAKRYLGLVVAWLLSYFSFAGVMRYIVVPITNNIWLQFVLGFAFGVIIQALMIFMVPAVLLSKERFLKRLWDGFLFGVRHLMLASGIILLPMLAIVVLSILKLFVPSFIHILPELVLWILIGGIVVTICVDFIVTSSTTILFLEKRRSM